MATLLRLVGGVLLIAHGFVHLLYVADDVGEFTLEDSWLIPDASARTVGIPLMWATVVAFGLVGLSVWGTPGLASMWPAIAIVAALLSMVLLIVFWNWSLMLGVLIDVAVITVAVVRPEWTERLHG